MSSDHTPLLITGPVAAGVVCGGGVDIVLDCNIEDKEPNTGAGWDEPVCAGTGGGGQPGLALFAWAAASAAPGIGG